MKNVFVTGCTGYIGSHTCVELLDSGYEVVGLDNFSNSKPKVLDSIREITSKDIKFYEGNMLDRDILVKIFSENKIDVVIDFAAYKSVGDSVSNPVDYYINNVSSVLTLLSVMMEFNVKNIILVVLLQYMVILRLFLLLKSVKQAILLILMVLVSYIVKEY